MMIPRRPRPRRLVAAGLLLLSALGCSDEGAMGRRVATHPTRGRVLAGGKPVADALVVFQPTSDGGGAGVPRPTGRTDAEGKFTLHTYAGADGASAGSYRVGIANAPAHAERRDVMRKVAAKPAAAVAIAPRYADPGQSGLTAEVKPGDNDLPAFEIP